MGERTSALASDGHNASRFVYEVDGRGCWIWTGYCDSNGYARIYNREAKQVQWAHRFSYEAYVGPITPGCEVDHMCQVTRCVNPEHLQQLTRREHVRVTMQRLGKDDLHLGAAHLRRMGATYSEVADALGYMSKTGAHRAVLSAIEKGLINPDDVPKVKHVNNVERQEIIDLVAIGIPQGVVGELYGLHNSQVSRISRGLNSGHRRSA